jgi:hypothetical protein
MSEFPEPLTPSDCDVRALPFMPLDVVRLLDSDIFALSTGDEFKAALALWCKSWLQIPAASLPDDDRVLAHLSSAGSKWAKVKEIALRGWIKASDGRLYHPVVAEKALEGWMARQGGAASRETHAEKMRRWRDAKKRKNGDGGDSHGDSHGDVTPTITEPSRDNQCDRHVTSLTQTGTQTEKVSSAGEGRTPRWNDTEVVWEAFTGQAEVCEDAQRRATYRGVYIRGAGTDVLDAARINDVSWRGDFRPLIAWLDEGIEFTRILAAVKRVAGRPGYKPPASLKFFDGAVREQRA